MDRPPAFLVLVLVLVLVLGCVHGECGDAMDPIRTYRRQTVYVGEPSERTTCVVGDINGDGVPEIVVGSRRPRAELIWLGRDARGEWQAHLLDEGFQTLEAGGFLFDVDGDGDLDLIAGHDSSGNALFWWECPDDPTQRWTRREILRMPANKSHDQLVADLDGDGRPEVYFWNQGSKSLFTVPIPDDPKVSPWPGVRAVATGVHEEGLAVADVDGDGKPELIAGLSWYRPRRDGTWERHVFAEGFVSPRLAAADFDGDGRVEIALAEGDASLNGRPFGRLALLRCGADPTALWEGDVLLDGLLEPHSLAAADFDGDGRPDLFVGEMGSPNGTHQRPPCQRLFLNRGGRFEERIIDQGVGTHEAKVIVLDGRVGIAGKPYRNLRSEAPRGPDVDGVHLWLPFGGARDEGRGTKPAEPQNHR